MILLHEFDGYCIQSEQTSAKRHERRLSIPNAACGLVCPVWQQLCDSLHYLRANDRAHKIAPHSPTLSAAKFQASVVMSRSCAPLVARTHDFLRNMRCCSYAQLKRLILPFLPFKICKVVPDENFNINLPLCPVRLAYLVAR